MTGAKYKIHFMDDYGTGTIECDTNEEFCRAMDSVREDPKCEDIWYESYDELEGWQAC